MMKKIVIAMDSFKGSLSAAQATHISAETVRACLPTCDVVELPMTDGGEGFAGILASNDDASMSFMPVDMVVHGPLASPVAARYFYNNNTHTAIMELAAACGLTLVDDAHRNPLKTSTFGVGEMILDAVQRGASHIVLGIGGSATNDAGTGLLSALGFRFLDKNGIALHGCGENLAKIRSIDSSNVNKKLFDVSFTIACDVNNPLLGECGASRVYGPQKGADEAMVELLECGMKNFAEVVDATYNIGRSSRSGLFGTAELNYLSDDIANSHISCTRNSESSAPGSQKIRYKNISTIPGGGAAGGVGSALYAFLNAQLKPGIDVILDILNFDEIIKDANLIITGEGSLDEQTVNGKVAMGILKHAMAQGVPTIAIGGQLTAAKLLNNAGFTACFSIINTPCSLHECLSEDLSKYNLNTTITQIINLINNISYLG